MRKVIALMTLAMTLAAYSGGIGGCGNSSDNAGDAGATAGDETRNMTGAVASSESALTRASSAGGVSSCEGSAIAAIATATDGTAVREELFENCGMSLPLKVGKNYVVNFVNESEEFVASLVAPSGSVFEVLPGDSDIDLGTVEIANGMATFSGDFLAYIDTDGDGTMDRDDDTPCGGDSCTEFYSCEYFGFSDSDGDKICDEWDGELPSAEDMPGSESGSSGGSGGSSEGSSDSGSGATQTLSVWPSSTILYPGQTKQFRATVAGETVSDVTWSLSESASYGSVDANGLYTAPATLPSGDHVVLTATSSADESFNDTADIFIVEGAGESDYTDYSCNNDNDCLSLHGLPSEVCSTTLYLDSTPPKMVEEHDLETSCSYVTNCYIGYTCSGENIKTGEHICALWEEDDDGDNDENDDGFRDGYSSGGGPGPYNGYSDMGSFDMSGGCLTTLTYGQICTYLRSGPGGFCEEPKACTTNTDCPGNSFCFWDGHCLSGEGLDSLGILTCDPAVGCGESSHDLCVSIMRSDSTCGNYCMGENIVRFCLTDTDCNEGEVCIGGDIGEEQDGFCSWNGYSACE